MMRLRFLTICVLAAAPAVAQDDLAAVKIGTEKVADGIYMLTGRGGNIGLFVGKDGAFLIDDQYAPLSEKILAAVKAVTPDPVRFVVNTHWHADHTGGNENMGKTGALLVAHENVRRRMSTEQFSEAFKRKTPPSPADALPVVTFAEGMTFHWNGDEVRVFHVPPAHTDGDAVVQFVGANVVHMGDILFNGSYPYIDTSSGGRIDGMVEAVGRVLRGTDEKTRFIPGHGPLGSRADLVAYREMLGGVRDRIASLRAAGKTRDEVIAAKPTAKWDAKWGAGFMKPDVFVGIAYDSLK